MKTLKVKAATGLVVPQEFSPRLVITDNEYLIVPATAYYYRRIQTGELVVYKAEDVPLQETDTKKRGVTNGKS